MEWEITYFSEAVQNQIMSFPKGMQARYLQLVRRMVMFGPNLRMPHTRAFGEGLFELRIKSKEGIGRVFFCTLPCRRIMALHSFVKKSAKTPSHELRIARIRLKEVRDNADAQTNGQENVGGP